MQPHRRVTTVAAVVALLIGPPATAGPGGPEAGSLPAQGSLEALSQALDHTAVLPGPGRCGVTVGQPGYEPIEAACSDAAPDAEAAVELTAASGLAEVAAFETPRHWAGYYPLDDGAGHDVVVRAHVGGGVAVTTTDGDEVWYRPSSSFAGDWGVDPAQVPLVMLGAAPANPMMWGGDRAVATGDLSGDGVDEIAVSHLVPLGPDEGVGAVTVLDARTGETLWSRTYPGVVTSMVVHDGTLVVAHETGDPADAPVLRLGEDGSVSTLAALTFTRDGGSLTATTAWDVAASSWTRWLDLESLGARGLAAAFSDKPVGAGGVGGQVVVLDAATGAVVWQRAFNGYPRHLRHDEAGDRLVVHDQSDPAWAYSYVLRSFALADGQPAHTLVRQNRLLLRLEVDDATGDGRSEWLTADAGIADDSIVAGHVAAVGPGAAEPLWQVSSLHGDGDMRLTYRLEVVDGPDGTPLVVAAAFETEPEWFATFDLRAHHGATGETAWVADAGVFGLFLVPVDDGRAVVGATDGNVVRRVRTGDGAQETQWPLPADVFAAAAADLTGDGTKELILGTHGGGVLAVVSDTLGDQPQYEWRTVVGDSVRELTVADVTGDGASEVVVAATTAVHVLRGSDGTTLYTIDYPDEFVWTVAVGDLTGDGAADIAVPTRSLAGYRGSDGAELWRYQPAGDPERGPTTYFSTTVVAGGKAVAAFNLWPHMDAPLAPRTTLFAVAIDGAAGEVAWQQANASPGDIPRLWRSAALLPGQGLDGGDAVGFVYDHFNPAPLVFPSTFGHSGGLWSQMAVVHDLGTGQMLTRSGPLDTRFRSVHEGALAGDGGILQVTWGVLNRFRSGGAEQIGWDTGAVFAAAFADFGTLGKVLLAGEGQGLRIVAYPADVPWGDPEDHLEPLGSWSGLHTGDLLVADLTGDGTDEVVTFKRDDEARSRVAASEGTLYASATFQPFGVVILGASAEGP